ncbi:translocation and assembly module TamA [Andreprevotia lacus DSM 23236]|jgi:translocation and assembly module TamA|uniref:Translocation and assembly module TamA n=1 Tax=Andreprevotia lacus DSM 23236 TaxID=1121001 RepID=A0A1W1XZ61_9NEIS|nr:autotransporter assembly complex family protein [Andreprevotia lacus]SMC29259.1 translocation and assembly module TamA [Andreprevotia lacus DSM 23236]
MRVDCHRFLLSVCLALACGLAHARYTVTLDAPGEVSDLLQRHLDIYRWRDDAKFDKEGLAPLVERIPVDATALLNTAGYFAPKVVAHLDSGVTPPQVRIFVVPGEPTRFRNVDFKLQGAIIDDPDREDRLQQRIVDAWQINPGQVFTQSGWDDAKRRVLQSLQNSRYPAARLEKNEVRIDPATASADVTLVADSGPLYHYGEIKVEGLQRYPEKLVTELIDFKAGDVYRRRDLLNLQSQLESLPYFGGAVVEAPPGATAPWQTPVTVRVQEVPLQRITVSAGYSTTSGPRGTASYSYNNLLDRGWVFDAVTALDRDTQALALGVSFPERASGYSHRVYTAVAHSDVENLQTQVWKVGVSRSLTGLTGTNGIDRQIALEYLTERRDRGGEEIDELNALTANYRWVRRDLDNQRDPHRGTLLQLEVGGAVRGVLSDQTFVRVYGRGQHYLPFAGKGILISRLELGQTITRESTNVPTDWLFRAGGAGSVRGYDYQSLGIPGSDNTVVPAQVIATASLEAQYPVYKDWRGAVFVDYGDAAASISALKPVAGMGAGARWVSPVGVVGADLAYGFDRKQVRFYFSLGMAF